MDEFHTLDLSDKIDKITLEITLFNQKFDSLVHFIHLRGFKSYGFEGQMREHIHNLEKYSPPLNKINLLTVRRHEKDFLLRKEIRYLDSVHIYVRYLDKEIDSKISNRELYRELKNNLAEYEKFFEEIVDIEVMMGLYSQKGLKTQIIELTDDIEIMIKEIDIKVFEKAEEVSFRIKSILIVVMLMGISLNIILGYMITQRLGQPIIMLSESIHNVIRSNFEGDAEIELIPTKDEIGILSRDIRKMHEKLRQVNQATKRKSEEITLKNQELEQQKEEIWQQAENLSQINLELDKSLEKINRKNKELEETLLQLKTAQAQIVQSEKMASLGQLTAGIAHEINNPINFVSAGSDILEQNMLLVKELLKQYQELEKISDTNQFIGEITKTRKLKKEIGFPDILEDIDSLINDIKAGAKRTIQIVNGLKTFSRLDENTIKKTNLSENIDAILLLLENKVRNRIEIVRHYEPIPDVLCHVGEVNQALMGVLLNAIEAIDQKGTIKIRVSHKENKIACITIEDNGRGIPEDIVDRVFEPFFTTKDVGEGAGLGLFTTHNVIKKHQGRIFLDSYQNKGTSVHIELPIDS